MIRQIGWKKKIKSSGCHQSGNRVQNERSLALLALTNIQGPLEKHRPCPDSAWATIWHTWDWNNYRTRFPPRNKSFFWHQWKRDDDSSRQISFLLSFSCFWFPSWCFYGTSPAILNTVGRNAGAFPDYATPVNSCGICYLSGSNYN